MSKQADTLSNKTKVSGVILIDKPQGMTSQQVVSKVKYLFQSPKHNSKKAGHTGTLDPMATGLLPICLGEATKFSHYQLDADKSYRATVLLGAQTDTGDAEGQVIQHMAVPVLKQDLLDAIAKQFMGAQQQVPPMYSALKKDGKKLYEYARAGIEVERPPRAIVIKDIALHLISDTRIELTVTCSKGTYVRVLAEDIAQALGTVGHLTALRRLQVGNFTIDNAVDLPTLEAMTIETRQTQLLPVDACIDINAKLALSAEQVARVRLGQRLNVTEQIDSELKAYLATTVQQQLSNPNTLVDRPSQTDISGARNTDTNLAQEIPTDIRLVDESGCFIGLGALSLSGRLQPKKLIQL